MSSENKKHIGLYILILLVLAELIDWTTSFYFSMNDVSAYMIDLGTTMVFMIFIIKTFKGMKTAAEELQGNRKRLKDIFDTLDVAIWSHDLRSDTLLITSGIEKLYGYTSEEFYKDSTLWKKVIHPEDHYVLPKREDGLLRGEAVTSIYRIIRPNGEVRWFKTGEFQHWTKTEHLLILRASYSILPTGRKVKAATAV